MSILSIGMELGKTEGKVEMLVDLIVKKIKRGNTPEQIADMLEIDNAAVKQIYEVAKRYAPDYDVQKIFEAYQKAGAR